MLFVLMVIHSVQMAAHVANYSRASGVVVLYQKLFAVVTGCIAVQTDIPVMMKKERAPRETQLLYQFQ